MQAVFIDTHGFNKTVEPQHGQHLESTTNLYESPHLKNASHSSLLFSAGLKVKVCAVWQILIVSERQIANLFYSFKSTVGAAY